MTSRHAGIALLVMVQAGCATQRSTSAHGTAVTAATAVTEVRSSETPQGTAASTAPASAERASAGLVLFSMTGVELVGPAPRSLAEARFEVVFSDGPREILPVRDGDDRSPPTAQHRAPSFIVDYDRDPLRSRCRAPEGARDALAQLERADRFIERKSMAIGFITAGAALERREGDCTEHSVLAAALLRCNDTPARMSFGVLVFRVGAQIAAGGHMWTERYEDGWRLADATFPQREAEAAYLRLGSLSIEGPEGASEPEHDRALDVRAVRIRAR